MKIIALILLLLIILTLTVYDIKLNSDGYDILLRNRFTKLGFGIDFKGGLEIWHFAHTVHGGIAEKPLYPPAKRLFADTKTYKVDLDNDGKKEIITTEGKIEEDVNFMIESIITVTSADRKHKDSFSMPERLEKIEFVSLNKDGRKQIVVHSHSGMHYTNIAVYGYEKGRLHKIFEDGSACGIDAYLDDSPPLIKVGRANWDAKVKTEDGKEIDWSYASEPLWQVYRWDGKEFVYDEKLSTAPEISENEEANRFVDKVKGLLKENE